MVVFFGLFVRFVLFCFLLSFRKFSSSVQGNLSRGEGDLSDLVAINIRRAHDRGLPGYTRFRNLPRCLLRKVRTFEDLVTVASFDPTDVEKLKEVYEDVRDIDLFVGGEFRFSAVVIHVVIGFSF